MSINLLWKICLSASSNHLQMSLGPITSTNLRRHILWTWLLHKHWLERYYKSSLMQRLSQNSLYQVNLMTPKFFSLLATHSLSRDMVVLLQMSQGSGLLLIHLILTLMKVKHHVKSVQGRCIMNSIPKIQTWHWCPDNWGPTWPLYLKILRTKKVIQELHKYNR